ncbi:DUF3293 domain-containing protein [Noviherbaspirillum sp. CPCC 100848]|uniref:DUF3293 domain-containing protein n=1 Tax=Noviherbaspirillum album TaxID=3080276 RepID=A0ABU6JAV6_9BURK|nr:DUF3293 domain-containing protein [Noviherbaspirillum sp. CPCC 100848]MEC4720782.1 DUF3293 domain-containing protein [Noviherbaspirillum sp. CPCC 100848]
MRVINQQTVIIDQPPAYISDSKDCMYVQYNDGKRNFRVVLLVPFQTTSMKSSPNLPIEGATLSARQRAAYRVMFYSINLPRRLKLQAGIRNSELAQLLKTHGAATAAIVSACNPAGCLLPASKNKARHAALATAIKQLKLKALPAERKAESSADTAEDAYLVLDISGAQAESLLTEFDQHALLWCNQSGPPELMLHPLVRQKGPR